MSHLTVQQVRVLVHHHAPVVAAGLAAVLAKHAGFDVRCELECEDDPRCQPDVIVTDYGGGLSLLARDGRESAAKVLIVAASDRESEVRTALDAGAHGYVLVDCGVQELVTGVLTVKRGSRFLGSAVATRLADSVAHEALTQRELDVLLLMVRGMSNKLIARELDIALGTVKAHARSVFGKLRAATRLQAVAIAAKRGLVPAEQADAPRFHTSTRSTPAWPIH